MHLDLLRVGQSNRGTYGVLLALSMILLLSGQAWAQTVSAKLEWDNTDMASGLVVEKATKLTGPFVKLADLPAGVSSYVDGTVLLGQTVCYRVAYKYTTGLGVYAGPTCKSFPMSQPAAVKVK
jgi:hypothetical protein